MYLTFHPDISLKKGVFFSLFSLWTPEKFNKGVIQYLCLLYLKIIEKWSIDRGYIEQCSGFRGVSKAEKACEKPGKGGFRNFGSPESMRGVLSKGGNEHTRTLNNTEWGGGGGGRGVTKWRNIAGILNKNYALCQMWRDVMTNWKYLLLVMMQCLFENSFYLLRHSGGGL